MVNAEPSRQLPSTTDVKEVHCISTFRKEPNLRHLAQNAVSESSQSMSSQTNRMDIEIGRPTNKRSVTHLLDDAAPRSKRKPNGTFNRNFTSAHLLAENKSPNPALKRFTSHGEATLQRGSSWSDPHLANASSLSSPQTAVDSAIRGGKRELFPASSRPKYLGAQAPQLHRKCSRAPTPSSPVNTYSEGEGGILLQPETRPINHAQLVNEVKGIYAGLVMVDKKCLEIDQEQPVSTTKLTNEQWQALIALHRPLLHEHHDFFLASQHPAASPALKKLATKYAMDTCMWRHGIHSFLELLRHRLPDSLDHMLSFVYLAYSTIGLLMESVPSLEDIWTECLGDLARYRMSIEEVNMRDREVWAGVARMWYEKAADRSPNVGRMQHHLAVLARPNIDQQLFYYSKALVNVHPFANVRESIMLLFDPFLANGKVASGRYHLVEAVFLKAVAIHFTRGSTQTYIQMSEQFRSTLNSDIGRNMSKFRTQDPEVASTLAASLFDFGNIESPLWKFFVLYDSQHQTELEKREMATGQMKITPKQEANIKKEQRQIYFKLLTDQTESPKVGNLNFAHSTSDPTTKDTIFSGIQDLEVYACHLFYTNTELVSYQIRDKSILPSAQVVLALLNSLAYVHDALTHIEGQVPWEVLVTFLNTLGRSRVISSHVNVPACPQPLSGTGRQLPEDFVLRSLIWAKHYFPGGFCQSQFVDEDERTLELPSHAVPRTERCWWLRVQLTSSHFFWWRKDTSLGAIARPQESNLFTVGQNNNTQPEYKESRQSNCMEQTTVTITLRKLSRILWKFAPLYLGLNMIPVAFAHGDYQTSNTTISLNGVTVLVLVVFAVIAGQMTKANLLHASGLSAWTFCVLALVWDQSDTTTKFIGIAIGLSSLLPAVWRQMQKKWRANDLNEKHKVAIIESKSNIHMKEGYRPSGSRQPLIILIILADPTDQPRLRLLEEKRALDQALQLTGLFELRDVPSCRPQDLVYALLRHKPTVMQFSGHGSEQGLCFEDDTGRSRCVNPQDLVPLLCLASSEHGLKAVVLNSCFSKTQAQSIADAVGFVVAMNGEISDPAALAFTRSFYIALGEGQSVEKAFEWAAAGAFLQTSFNSLHPILVTAQTQQCKTYRKSTLRLDFSTASQQAFR